VRAPALLRYTCCRGSYNVGGDVLEQGGKYLCLFTHIDLFVQKEPMMERLNLRVISSDSHM
jgi:hypothetical protein